MSETQLRPAKLEWWLFPKGTKCPQCYQLLRSDAAGCYLGVGSRPCCSKACAGILQPLEASQSEIRQVP